MNGTIPVYCQEVPSTKLSPLAGLKPAVHEPSTSLGCMDPEAGLNFGNRPLCAWSLTMDWAMSLTCAGAGSADSCAWLR